MQLKSLAKIQSVLADIDNLKNVTDEMDALKDIGKKYSRDILKSALAQSELEDTQIEKILKANKMQGALLETTTNQLANAASANKMAKAQKAASNSALGFGEAITGYKTKVSDNGTSDSDRYCRRYSRHYCRLQNLGRGNSNA